MVLYSHVCCRLRYLCHILRLHGLQCGQWAGRVVTDELQRIVKKPNVSVIHAAKMQTVHYFWRVYVSVCFVFHK